MGAGHALLSPSKASRWLTCTPSARFEEHFADSTSDFAKEGTLAHKLGELLIKQTLKLVKPVAFKTKLAEIKADPLYSAEMYSYCDDYRVFIVEKINAAKQISSGVHYALEDKMNMERYIKEGFGTTDFNLAYVGFLEVIDLKYGKGVFVSAEENKQMMVYGLAGLEKYDLSFDIHTVRMTIYQPRLDNFSTWEISADELRQWGENELKPKADLAFHGEGLFVAGSHCKFCRAAGKCKALAERAISLAKLDFENVILEDEPPAANTLTDHEITMVVLQQKLFEDWLHSVKTYALNQALEGKKWGNLKLVEGISKRKYVDEKGVAEYLKKQGKTDEEIYVTKLLTITELENLVSKKTVKEELGAYIVKPRGALTLVIESDPRPAHNSAAQAADDFKNIVTDDDGNDLL